MNQNGYNWNPNGYDWMSEGISPKDAPAWIKQRAIELGDLPSPLMERLKEIMPKNPEQPKYNSQHFCIEVEPIRKATDSFVSWMNDDLPANKEELYAMLLAFGKITSGYMEFMLRHSMRISDDLLATLPIKPTMIHLSEIGEVTKEQIKEMFDTPKNPTLKFDHCSTERENHE